eukprot:CAMPEP_0116916404 /NCGR_PEP_ID=MMETSP0467-20121206/18507_1 /TAXON_ID=283647 /ORGANISM="Mesodinium pulex, Strain SPMC105" /LENGTH=463 /DNA_ID=CAMNT_0004593259 /DNA_START=84 /DNA_END=1478 /DNA_ORIENTATION=+
MGNNNTVSQSFIGIGGGGLQTTKNIVLDSARMKRNLKDGSKQSDRKGNLTDKNSSSKRFDFDSDNEDFEKQVRKSEKKQRQIDEVDVKVNLMQSKMNNRNRMEMEQEYGDGDHKENDIDEVQMDSDAFSQSIRMVNNNNTNSMHNVPNSNNPANNTNNTNNANRLNLDLSSLNNPTPNKPKRNNFVDEIEAKIDTDNNPHIGAKLDQLNQLQNTFKSIINNSTPESEVTPVDPIHDRSRRCKSQTQQQHEYEYEQQSERFLHSFSVSNLLEVDLQVALAITDAVAAVAPGQTGRDSDRHGALGRAPQHGAVPTADQRHQQGPQHEGDGKDGAGQQGGRLGLALPQNHARTLHHGVRVHLQESSPRTLQAEFVKRLCEMRVVMRNLDFDNLFWFTFDILYYLLLDNFEKLGELTSDDMKQGEKIKYLLNQGALRVLENVNSTLIIKVLLKMLRKVCAFLKDKCV